MKLNRREFLFGKRAFREDDKGATAIEYGLIASVIALVIFGSMGLAGRRVEKTFFCIRARIRNHTPAFC